MKATPDCIPCSIRQALRTARYITKDERLCQKAMDGAMEAIIGTSLSRTPAAISEDAVRAGAQAIGNNGDPYREAKKHYNELVLGMLPELKEILAQSEDRLHTAIKLAAVGNIIDMGIVESFDIRETIQEVLDKGFAVDHYQDFRRSLSAAERILYLVDNAGEIVFDRILVEELPREKVQVAVKGKPILNDATREDAGQVGMPEVAEVISLGGDALGTPLPRTSVEFQENFRRADLIISKGQANYETLIEDNIQQADSYK